MALAAEASYSPSMYATAPTSPSAWPECYYSAPVSPVIKTLDESKKEIDDFEFETSKKFSGPLLGFDQNETCLDQERSKEEKYRERGDSLPAMAFADELFFNGLVMPLKLPPRLQYDSDFSQSSFPSSPNNSKLPARTACMIPFGRVRNAWNDDFDPFMVALQKVTSEETRGRIHGGLRHQTHRRTRSFSPFRNFSKNTSSDTEYSCDDQSDENRIFPTTPPAKTSPSSFSGPLDFKGSAYARWVRDQAREAVNQSAHDPKSPIGFLFGQRVNPEEMEQDQKTDTVVVVNEGSKVQKLKGLILKYTSFGRDDSGEKKCKKTGAEAQKPSYFSRLSFKFKGNGKKKMPAAAAAADKKMAIVEYKPPTISLCFGYSVESPR